jgi:hypothetical protein
VKVRVLSAAPMTEIKEYFGVFREHMEQGMDHMIYCLWNNDPFFKSENGNYDRIITWEVGDRLVIYEDGEIIYDILIHEMDSLYLNPPELSLDVCTILARCCAKTKLIKQ